MDGIILDCENSQKSHGRFYWSRNSGECVGEGLIIHHNGSIVVNGSSKVGKNCQLHGDNCIGNVGKADSLTDCPQIGNNVEIGVGAKVLGGIIIADNIKIGANAVVTKSFDEKGITLVGIPAHKLER